VSEQAGLGRALADQWSPAVSTERPGCWVGADIVGSGDLGTDKAGVEVKNEVGSVKPEREMRLGKKSVSRVHSVEI